VGLLICVAPWLAEFALSFSFYEKFWLGVFGLSLSAVVSSGETRKGLMSACLGMLLSTVGIDIVSGAQRYTFGSVELMSGMTDKFIAVMIGLFGMSEVLRNVRRTDFEAQKQPRATEPMALKGALAELVRHPRTILQSSFIGTLIGALPGAGADIAAWGAYGIAQKTSKNADQFGSGVVEGVIAPTSANNAAVAGAWIPALVFGVPGDAVTAIVLGALMMYQITPGPHIFENSGDQIRAVFRVALLTQLLLIPAGLAGIKAFGWIVRLPRGIVMTAVVVFSVVGAYALHNSMFDVYLMLAFGVVGFFLESRRVPLAPLILGLILGPMVEENLRTGLINSDGNWLPFFTRPICAVLAGLMVLSLIVLPAVRWARRSSERGLRSAE
jgi:TctA family transporter